MIVVDSSVIIAILLRESEAEFFARALATAQQKTISTFTYVETSVVFCGRKKDRAVASKIDDLLDEQGVELFPYDQEQARLSRDAYLRFGKGFHKAALNLGDCVSYALAKSFDAPLLCKGADFHKTDVRIWSD